MTKRCELGEQREGVCLGVGEGEVKIIESKECNKNNEIKKGRGLAVGIGKLSGKIWRREKIIEESEGCLEKDKVDGKGRVPCR